MSRITSAFSKCQSNDSFSTLSELAICQVWNSTDKVHVYAPIAESVFHLKLAETVYSREVRLLA